MNHGITTQHCPYAQPSPAPNPGRQSREPSRLLAARRNATLKELSRSFCSPSSFLCPRAPSSPRKAGAPLISMPAAAAPQSPPVTHILFLIKTVNISGCCLVATKPCSRRHWKSIIYLAFLKLVGCPGSFSLSMLKASICLPSYFKLPSVPKGITALDHKAALISTGDAALGCRDHTRFFPSP